MVEILKTHRACDGRGCTGCDNGFIRVKIQDVFEIKPLFEPQQRKIAGLLSVNKPKELGIRPPQEKNPVQRFVNKPINLLRLRR